MKTRDGEDGSPALRPPPEAASVDSSCRCFRVFLCRYNPVRVHPVRRGKLRHHKHDPTAGLSPLGLCDTNHDLEATCGLRVSSPEPCTRLFHQEFTEDQSGNKHGSTATAAPHTASADLGPACTQVTLAELSLRGTRGARDTPSFIAESSRDHGRF